ncbi:MAG: hypothetical protein U9R70_07540 [Pseudomonadota bacterium]|nr:hypothetical protein [Pseudomonadota bacterium]
MSEPTIIDMTTAPRKRRATKSIEVERAVRAVLRAGFSVAVVRVLENGDIVFEREGVAVAAEKMGGVSDADAAFQGWESGIHAIAA